MSDKKIIKALEEYVKENEFEYFHSNTMNEYPLIKKALNLINRQKAEIEALIAGQETLQKNLAKSLKVEAYNEIAESVKIKTLAMVHSPVILTTADYIKCIDDIVKEWEGENND